jgi:hypothetical protein
MASRTHHLLRNFIRESLCERASNDIVTVDSFDAGTGTYEVTAQVDLDEMGDVSYKVLNVVGANELGEPETVDPRDFERALLPDERESLEVALRSELEAQRIARTE